jgi:hypothetical protein
LARPCSYPVISTGAPSKDKPKPWWSRSLWDKYLGRGEGSGCLTDADFSTTEHNYGIGIDPDTATQDGVRIYSAHYLRLQPNWSLGVLAHAPDKEHSGDDIVSKLIHHDQTIITGGQQRLCTAQLLTEQSIPLPHGTTITGTKVKWALLSPAIFPQINDHPGGWLPSWVDTDGDVQLLDGPGKNYAQRHKVPAGQRISAKLVAAIVGKSVPVTGYALPHEAADRPHGGAKPTLLAVPAGSIYYFEADSPIEAEKLANALNWHGPQPSEASNPRVQITNRRSTLLGEKGFGLGVCAPWDLHPVTD